MLERISEKISSSSSEFKIYSSIKDTKSLVVVENIEKIKQFLRCSFEYVLDSIIDPNVRGFVANECYLAGGCIRNFIIGKPINDLDLFFKKKEYINEFKNLIDNRYNVPVFVSDIKIVANTINAVTCLNRNTIIRPFQFITKPGRAGNPIDVVYNTFDFTNCMGWYDPAQDELEISKMLEALNSGKLVYNLNSTNPLNSIKRLIKFQKMGFEVTEQCLFDMFKQSKELTHEDEFRRYKFDRKANY